MRISLFHIENYFLSIFSNGALLLLLFVFLAPSVKVFISKKWNYFKYLAALLKNPWIIILFFVLIGAADSIGTEFAFSTLGTPGLFDARKTFLVYPGIGQITLLVLIIARYMYGKFHQMSFSLFERLIFYVSLFSLILNIFILIMSESSLVNTFGLYAPINLNIYVYGRALLTLMPLVLLLSALLFFPRFIKDTFWKMKKYKLILLSGLFLFLGFGYHIFLEDELFFTSPVTIAEVAASDVLHFDAKYYFERQLNSQDEKKIEEALCALKALNVYQSKEQYERFLDHPNPKIVIAAIDLVSSLQKWPEAWRKIDSLTTSKDMQIRRAALMALLENKGLQPKHIPLILEMIDKDPKNFFDWVGVAGCYGKYGKPFVNRLRKVLNDPNQTYKDDVIKSLGRIGPPANDSLNDLIAIRKSYTQRPELLKVAIERIEGRTLNVASLNELKNWKCRNCDCCTLPNE